MKVSDLKSGMLIRPRAGFVWKLQRFAYVDKLLCLSVERCPTPTHKDSVVIYVGEREDDDLSYGKQIVLWDGKKLSVNPSAWRVIVEVKEGQER